MKSFLFCLFNGLFALTAHAQSCLAIVPFPPGGSADINVRTLQKFNPDIAIDYKLGSFAANAAAFVEQRPDAFFFNNMSGYSNANPGKDRLSYELLQILSFQELTIVTSKNQSITDILTGPKMIGLSSLGSMIEVVSKQLKAINNNIEIVPVGSDAKTYPLLVSGEIDAAVVGTSIANQWVATKRGVTAAITLPFNKRVDVRGGTLHHYHFSGIFVSKNATLQQKENIRQCLRKATSNPLYVQAMKEQHIGVRDISEKETRELFNEHIRLLRAYDL